MLETEDDIFSRTEDTDDLMRRKSKNKISKL
jgi:hypothetical protein